MNRTALLWILLALAGCAGIEMPTARVGEEAGPAAAQPGGKRISDRLWVVGDRYQVRPYRVGWSMSFPVGRYEPFVVEEQDGYWGFADRAFVRLMKDRTPPDERDQQEMMESVSVSFWIDDAGKCGNSARACRDRQYDRQVGPGAVDPKVWESGGVFLLEYSTEKLRHLYAHFVMDGVWVHYHLSHLMRPGYETRLLDFLRAVRFEPRGKPPEPPAPGPFRDVRPGVDDVVTIRGMTLRLPAAPGWQRREAPMPLGGMLYEFERPLPGGHRGQVHVADYEGPLPLATYDFSMLGRSDAERLAVFVHMFESSARRDPLRSMEWTDAGRAPQRRDGAACRELRVVRDEQDRAAPPSLWRDWMLLCIDPVARAPVQVDYAERYPAGGAASAGFEQDAAAVFDAIRFGQGGN